MASVRNRPLGHKLGLTQYTGTIFDDGSGDAIVSGNKDMTGIDYVYIETNFDSYNGFKLVESTGYGPLVFKIRNSPISAGDTPIQFIQGADVIFYVSILDHGWQSVHLPIVYELQSELYPTNRPEEDTTHKSITSFSNVNGYTQINASVALNAPEALEFIEIVGTGDLAGVYQIISVVDSDSIVIDLAYNAAYNFTGYHVLKYYNNYFISVNVYSGLDIGHRWRTEPMKLVATLRLIPDENNVVKFSISELLKGDINSRNNLTLDTLPNNLDFMTEFKIGFFETWDEAVDGEIITESTSESLDTFTGHAINSMMPFKSLNESFMSDYINGPDTPARWLTLFDRPVAVVGYFFDLSFILIGDSDIVATINKSNGSSSAEEMVEIPNPGTGVIRVPFIPESGYDLYCISVSTLPVSESLNLASFANTGSGISWTTGATPSVSLTSSQESKILFIAFPFFIGSSYTISATINYNVTAIFGFADLRVYDSSNNVLQGSNAVLSGSGSYTLSLSFTGVAGAARIGLTGHNVVSGGTSITVTNVSISTNARDITEQICIDIIEECGTTFKNDNLRITEDGYFRELE